MKSEISTRHYRKDETQTETALPLQGTSRTDASADEPARRTTEIHSDYFNDVCSGCSAPRYMHGLSGCAQTGCNRSYMRIARRVA